MTNQYQMTIPRGRDGDLIISLGSGDVLYLLGANGSGKSSLVSRLFQAHQASAKRISAHRQTWFQSNSLDMTPHTREDIDRRLRTHDAQEHARYRLDYPNERAAVAIYDLIDADSMIERKIAGLVRAGNTLAAEKEARVPSPLNEINELMRLSNIPIEISLEKRQKIVAKKSGSPGYSIAELSDGERNAFLIAADVLTAESGTILIIDEPERHLHRSIISPLLRILFGRREDCVFVVSTHDIMLPLDTPKANTLLVRGCQYSGSNVQSWTADVIAPGAQIDEDLKRDLLGSRRKMIFVEGAAHSLDAPLYSLLYPQVSIVPKDSCRDVESAVRGLRNAEEMHWLAAWGIVDKDGREADDIDRLKQAGVWALSHYSVESLYYLRTMVTKIAKRQGEIFGEEPNGLDAEAINGAIAAAKNNRDHLIEGAVLRLARRKFFERLPKKKTDVRTSPSIKVEVHLESLRSAEEIRFDRLITTSDWDGLLTHYPLRESSAFDWIADGLKLKDRTAYQSAVLKLLKDDDAALSEMRKLLGSDLYTAVIA